MCPGTPDCHVVRYVPNLNTSAQGILRPVSSFVELKIATAMVQPEKALPLRFEMFQVTWMVAHVQAGGNALLAVSFQKPAPGTNHDGVFIRVTPNFRKVLETPYADMFKYPSVVGYYKENVDMNRSFERVLQDMA